MHRCARALQRADTDAGANCATHSWDLWSAVWPFLRGLTIDSTTGQIDWTPTLAQVGQTKVIVRVTDAHGGFDDERLTIEVVPPAANNNRVPGFITSAIRSAVVDRQYRYDVDAEDLDHDL